MKLNNEKKVLICQKALYAEQLVHYKELCRAYEELANIAINKHTFKNTDIYPVADQVRNYYEKYLTMAAKGDLSFIERNAKTADGILTHRFNRDQIRAFRNYALAAQNVSTYKTAAEKLHNATYDGENFDIDQGLMEDFHEFMQESPSTKRFEERVAECTTNYVAHTSFKKAANALNIISKIDKNHLRAVDREKLTPKSFGLRIDGARGAIDKDAAVHSKSNRVDTRLANEFISQYTEKEVSQYSKNVSIFEEMGNAIHKTGYHAKENVKHHYRANKGSLDKALKRLALIGASVLLVTAVAKGIDRVGDAIDFNKTSAYNNPQLGYVQTIEDDTMQTLQDTDTILQNLENSPTTPTKEELHEARNAVDDEINLVISDLVRNSFEAKYPNLVIPEGGVVIHYNDKHIDPESGKEGNYIYINCHDVNGKPYTFTIEHFSSQGEDRVGEAFDDERKADDLVGDINASGNSNYSNNTISVKTIIDEMKEIHENTVELAGAAGEIDIPEAAYANNQVSGNEGLLDFVKAKYSKFLGFFANAKFKLVTPLQVKTAEPNFFPATEAPTNDGDER